MDSLITTFHIDWQMMIAQVVNFAVVFFVLYRFAIKPLKKMLDERTETISKGLVDADTHAKLLNQTKADYDAELTRARQEGFAVIEEAKKQAEKERASLLAHAKVESTELLEATKKTLESEKMKMLREAQGELASLITQATQKVLEGTVTTKIDQELVEHSLKNIHHD